MRNDDDDEIGGGAMTTEAQDTSPPTDLDIFRANPDPSTIGWPPSLPVELALADSSPKDICEAYSITRERFLQLIQIPAFQKAFADAKEMLTKDGMAFRAKARMQAEGLLPESWRLIHSQYTPAAVKAKLIEATWRVAGFEPKESDRTAGQNLQININLG